MTEKHLNCVIVQGTAYSWMNLNNKKSAYYDFMETIMAFLISCPALAMTVYFIVKDTVFFYRAYLCLPFLLCFWAARNYISKNYLYILSFIPVFTVLFYITGPLGERIPVFIYMIFAAIFSIMKRLTR
jgi:hypothetical protein